MSALNTILLIIIIIVSAICTVPFLLFGIIEFFQGPEDTKKLLKKWNLPWSYKRILVVGFICYAILLIATLLQKILSGELL